MNSGQIIDNIKKSFTDQRVEKLVALVVLFFLILVPVAEIILRKAFRTGLPGSAAYVKHLVVWITFLGGMLASKEGKHLALSAGITKIRPKYQPLVTSFINLISTSVCTTLTWSALSLVIVGFDADVRAGIIPIQLAISIIPIGYLVIAVRFAFSGGLPRPLKYLPIIGFLVGTALAVVPISNILYDLFEISPEFLFLLSDQIPLIVQPLKWVAIIFFLAIAVLGVPLFVIVGGITLTLFSSVGGYLSVIPNEAYSMLISPTIPAIPLFTLAGFILSESRSGERLVALFRSFFGWLPGGVAIATVIVCAFFTTFTGASGVTILALGALLTTVLKENGYTESFSNGMLTASGSIGLLFPPSLPIILYGVVAQTSIKHVFLGGIIPGFVMVAAVSLVGIVVALRGKRRVIPFKPRDALASIRLCIGEILLPVIVILSYFLGFATLVESAALAVFYVIILEVWIHRDFKLRELPKKALKSVPVIGGVLIILTVARGLSYFIVDAEVPAVLSSWLQDNITSKYLFLILLNLVLLVVGCLLDIFSAIVVVGPILVPLGEIFGIHPVHLGMIFLANLELGYLTPPVGLNLFLASYRFEKPLVKIYKYVFPFFLVLLLTVLLITYVPQLSTALLPTAAQLPK